MPATPGLTTALTAWLLAASLVVGCGLLIGPDADPLHAVLLAQGAAALPVLILLLRLPAQRLGLGRVGGRALAGGLALGVPAMLLSILAGLLTVAIAGQPPAGQAVERVLFDLHDRFGLAGTLLLAAVLPGVVEEALFRGVILTSLRQRLPPWAAVAASALLFAVLHLSPWRLLPQFLLGCLLGWLTLRTGSCWPAAAAHAVHNAVLIAVVMGARGLA